VSRMMGSLARPEPFFIEHGGYFLHGDLLPKDADKSPEILFLHETLSNGRAEFLLLRQILWELYGLSSCAFDFIGYASLGKSLSLPLSERVAQTSDVVHACFDLQAFNVVAVANSAEIASCLTEIFPIYHWVAINPAVDCKLLGNSRWQRIDMPVEAGKTLSYLNNNITLLAKIAAKINALLGVKPQIN
jgi:hypothetical protein